MKFYLCYTYCHPKNIESIRCMLRDVTYIERSDLADLDNSYDVVFCFNTFYPPSAFPNNVKVIYGPHFFVFPDDPLHQLRTTEFPPHRFFYNTISEWNKRIHTSFAILPISYITCPFGLDMQSLQPIQSMSCRTNVMIYFKNRDPTTLDYAQRYVKMMDIPHTVIQYGQYKDHEFKEQLKTTQFVIWIGSHESQGFAFQETLALDIPILLWDAISMHDEVQWGRRVYEGRPEPLESTTATVWSDACGIRITEEDELATAIQQMLDMWSSYHPRDTINDAVSLQAAYANLLKSIQIVP